MVLFWQEVILSKTRDAFHIDELMAKWLADNCAWVVMPYHRLSDDEREHLAETSQLHPGCSPTLIEWDGRYIPWLHPQSMTLRTHPQLINCVKQLQHARATGAVNFLEIREIRVGLSLDSSDGPDTVVAMVHPN